MNIKKRVSVHNRFDIEVRDKESGKLKQKGVAENMILDRAYSRICNFATYFEYIHFGTGTGTPTPERTTLFTPLGYKAVTVDEKVKEYPISKVTKKITLAPEEYVGRTITEVGISEATNAINTHALIKDAEGNPLSITKTDLDVLIIYATVFIELQDTNDITFSKYPSNSLTNYFIDGSTMNPNLTLGDIGEPTPKSTIGNVLGSAGLTKTVDVANKKVSFATRLGTDAGNYDIRELALGDICRVNLENTLAWSPIDLKDISIGTGDGETTAFDLGRYDTSNVVIKVNGDVTNDYILENTSGENRELFPLWKLYDPNVERDSQMYTGVFVGKSEQVPLRDVTYGRTIEVNPDIVTIGEKISVGLVGSYSMSSASTVYLYLLGSKDGENFTNLTTWVSQNTNTPTYGQYTMTDSYTHLRFEWMMKGNGWGTIYYIKWLNGNYKRPQVVFNTPPAVDSLITADYTVPYIPKTSDYVLDVNFELQFGEGV